MAEYIDRDAVLWDLNHLWDWDSVDDITASTVLKQVITDVKNVPAADVVELPKGDIGELSDGYHTFNSLYEQRKILTAALVKAHRDISWKSKLHEDGELPFGGGWFINSGGRVHISL